VSVCGGGEYRYVEVVMYVCGSGKGGGKIGWHIIFVS
jgi:hypothetical protein